MLFWSIWQGEENKAKRQKKIIFKKKFSVYLKGLIGYKSYKYFLPLVNFSLYWWCPLKTPSMSSMMKFDLSFFFFLTVLGAWTQSLTPVHWRHHQCLQWWSSVYPFFFFFYSIGGLNSRASRLLDRCSTIQAPCTTSTFCCNYAWDKVSCFCLGQPGPWSFLFTLLTWLGWQAHTSAPGFLCFFC
jgi:hypothetical protein